MTINFISSAGHVENKQKHILWGSPFVSRSNSVVGESSRDVAVILTDFLFGRERLRTTEICLFD